MKIVFEIEKTCAVTGHRILEKDFDSNKLEKTFLKLIEEGYENFLIGMAVGYDTLCFRILEKLRKKYPIKLIACIPCRNQSAKFSEKQKNEYDEMLKVSDKNLLISENYTPSCMQKRNMFMVDNCSILVAYIRKNFGGSVNTVNYAMEQNKKIIMV